MGSIINSKTANDGKLIFEVLVDYEESLELKGHIKNVHLFSEDATDTKAKISLRGRKAATKYFLIPKDLRKDLKFDALVKCQKIETQSKVIFVYVVDKLGF